jgi:hypothetical protein
MKKTVLAPVATTVLFAGCASTSGAKDDDAPSGSNADTSETAEDTSAEESESEDEAETGPIAFGQAFTYDDGLTIKVGTPSKIKPSKYAAFEPANAYVSVNIVVVNKTGKPLDVSMFTSTMQSGNEEASTVYDEKMEGSPMTKLLDGRESKFTLGFGVKDPADIVYEVSPDFEHESFIVTYS